MRQSEARAGGRLENQVAVVTGGAGGIGAAICREFSRQGATLAVFDLDLEAAEQLADNCRRGGGRAAAYRCDVSHRQDVERSAEAVEVQLGPVEIWVNNAGLSRVMPFLECDDELWDLLKVGGLELGCGRWIPSGFWLPGVGRHIEVRAWPRRGVDPDFHPREPGLGRAWRVRRRRAS